MWKEWRRAGISLREIKIGSSKLTWSSVVKLIHLGTSQWSWGFCLRHFSLPWTVSPGEMGLVAHGMSKWFLFLLSATQPPIFILEGEEVLRCDFWGYFGLAWWSQSFLSVILRADFIADFIAPAWICMGGEWWMGEGLNHGIELRKTNLFSHFYSLWGVLFLFAIPDHCGAGNNFLRREEGRMAQPTRLLFTVTVGFALPQQQQCPFGKPFPGLGGAARVLHLPLCWPSSLLGV